MMTSSGSRTSRSLFGVLALVMGCAFMFACNENDADDDIFMLSFQPVTPLTATEVRQIIERGGNSVDHPNLILAVVDRVGRILAVWRRNPASTTSDLNKAVAEARGAAFLSSSQGPLSTRTLEYISTFHFPPTFGPPQRFNDAAKDALYPPQRQTTGVANTPQGPLWQIFSTNRGATQAGSGSYMISSGMVAWTTTYLAGQTLPPPTNIAGDTTSSGPGLGYLPGGIPLYGDGGRVVGGVGAYILDDVTDNPSNPTTVNPLVMEFAALQAAGPFAFSGIPKEGAIFLVGQLLPYVEAVVRPVGVGPGPVAGDDFTTTSPQYVTVTDPVTMGMTTVRGGGPQPFGWLIGPVDDPAIAAGFTDGLTAAEVSNIVSNGIRSADVTRAAIRLPLGTPTRMIFAVSNREGVILGAFRMSDSPIFSFDVSVTKAREVAFLSDPTTPSFLPGLPQGIAITPRTLGFVTQPFFPPSIEGREPGPLFDVTSRNAIPTNFNEIIDTQGGTAPADRVGLKSGLCFFPGAAPIYKNGVLVGGVGVSGDGVEQDDIVTSAAVVGFEPPHNLRADNFSHDGVRLPYLKFPQLPGGGN